MHPQYIATVHEMLLHNLALPEHFYDYNADPLYHFYTNFYEFANTHFQGEIAKLQVPACYLVFSNDLSTNARAISTPGFKYIEINRGAIENMHAFFESKSWIFDRPEYASLKAFENILGNATYITLFQCYSIFLYYHEFAHLMQRSTIVQFSLSENENAQVTGAEVLENHTREFDADWLGASNMAITITQYLTGYYLPEELTSEVIGDLVVLGLTAIFCFFLKAAGYHQDLYFMVNQHPHPYIRINYITEFIIKTLSPNLPDNIILDESAIVTKAMKLSEALLQEEFGNPVQSFGETFLLYNAEILNHITQIIDYSKTMPTLCVNREEEEEA